MDQTKIAELEGAATAAAKAAQDAGGADESLNTVATNAKKALDDAKALLQDPVKKELHKVQENGRSEADKAAYNLKKNAERVRQLGGDPAKILGVDSFVDDDDDNTPLTRAEYKKMQGEAAVKTALELADTVEDESERDLIKHHITNTIRSTGKPEEDLKLAKALVYSIKNQQILEEENRRGAPQRHVSGSGAPAKRTGEVFTPTKEESGMMAMKGRDGKPLLTEADILKARELEGQ